MLLLPCHDHFGGNAELPWHPQAHPLRLRVGAEADSVDESSGRQWGSHALEKGQHACGFEGGRGAHRRAIIECGHRVLVGKQKAIQTLSVLSVHLGAKPSKPSNAEHTRLPATQCPPISGQYGALGKIRHLAASSSIPFGILRRCETPHRSSDLPATPFRNAGGRSGGGGRGGWLVESRQGATKSQSKRSPSLDTVSAAQVKAPLT